MSELAPVLRLDDYRTGLPPEDAPAADEVWAEVLAAARLFGTLRQAGMSVRFDTAPDGPPRVRVTDLQGRTIRDVAPSVACDPAALQDELLRPAG